MHVSDAPYTPRVHWPAIFFFSTLTLVGIDIGVSVTYPISNATLKTDIDCVLEFCTVGKASVRCSDEGDFFFRFLSVFISYIYHPSLDISDTLLLDTCLFSLIFILLLHDIFITTVLLFIVLPFIVLPFIADGGEAIRSTKGSFIIKLWGTLKCTAGVRKDIVSIAV